MVASVGVYAGDSKCMMLKAQLGTDRTVSAGGKIVQGSKARAGGSTVIFSHVHSRHMFD